MAFKKILVPLAGVDEDSAAFDAAFLLGRKSEAYIEALLAISTAATRVNKSSGKHARKSSITELRARVRALYPNRCDAFDVSGPGVSSKSGLSARLVEAFGSEAELIASHGRMADLVVLAHPSDHQHAWPNLSLETAVRETGRPVLLVPKRIDELGRRVVIAWNGSAEATRAIACALPILRGASHVLVVAVGETIASPTGSAVAEYLSCHGVDAKSVVVSAPDHSDGAVVAQLCLDGGADLIVMGAFTRQSAGTPVFGPMTQEMIRQVEWPVLMAN